MLRPYVPTGAMSDNDDDYFVHDMHTDNKKSRITLSKPKYNKIMDSRNVYSVCNRENLHILGLINQFYHTW